MHVSVVRLYGEEGRAYVKELASLRLRVFREYPYLYDGTMEYEEQYLDSYFRSKHSFILMLKHNGLIVGATTAIWAEDIEEAFKKSFIKHGMDPKEIFYFGESVLLKEYRGYGYGKLFFSERENVGKSLGFIKYLSFCAVVRKDNDPHRPSDYRPLDEFWKTQGFKLEPGLTTQYAWPDPGETVNTEKTMQFWLKKL